MLKIIRLLEQMENNLHQRGTRGYGASHPYTHGSKRVYGKSDYSIEDDEVIEDKSPVKVSKAFKKGR
tara:strand:- start:233 stop:433 length:201 start_codon:yes stop_codon:yes gene_type:complete